MPTMPQVACPEGEFRRVQQALAFWTIFFYRQTVTSACSAEPTTVLFIFGVTFFFTVSDIKVERFVKVNKENPWLIVVFIPLKKLSLTCIIQVYENVTKCQWRVSDLAKWILCTSWIKMGGHAVCIHAEQYQCLQNFREFNYLE